MSLIWAGASRVHGVAPSRAPKPEYPEGESGEKIV